MVGPESPGSTSTWGALTGHVGRSDTRSLLLLGIGIVGIAVRIWIWWSSRGTVDTGAWRFFGEQVHEHGLAYTYANVDRFNHPPLMGLYAAQAWDLTRGEELAHFARVIKVPGLVGDAVVLAVLTRIGGLPLFAAYATAPTAVLITSYHGNTDGLYVAFILLSALAFDRGRFFWAGLLFGAALNVKVLPVFLLPLLLIALPDRRALLRFAGGLALGAIPYLPLLPGSAGDMYRQMIAYNSVRNDWGIPAFLDPASEQDGLDHVAGPVSDAFVSSGRYLIVGAILLLAVAARFRFRLSMVEQFAIGGSLFLILAPGFGVQYILVVTPFLFLVSLAYGLAFAWLAGAFIAVRYWIPIGSGYPVRAPPNTSGRQLAGEIGVLAWATLIVFVWTRIRSAVARGPAARGPPA